MKNREKVGKYIEPQGFAGQEAQQTLCKINP